MKIDASVKVKVRALLKKLPKSLAHQMGVKYTQLSKDKVAAIMPVDNRTRQPFGLLHGGASVALAESLASLGAWLNVDESKFATVGIEINANHLRAVKKGKVIGVAVPIQRGRTIQVWETRISNEEGALVCISRCTLAVVPLERLGQKSIVK